MPLRRARKTMPLQTQRPELQCRSWRLALQCPVRSKRLRAGVSPSRPSRRIAGDGQRNRTPKVGAAAWTAWVWLFSAKIPGLSGPETRSTSRLERGVKGTTSTSHLFSGIARLAGSQPQYAPKHRSRAFGRLTGSFLACCP